MQLQRTEQRNTPSLEECKSRQRCSSQIRREGLGHQPSSLEVSLMGLRLYTKVLARPLAHLPYNRQTLKGELLLHLHKKEGLQPQQLWNKIFNDYM